MAHFTHILPPTLVSEGSYLQGHIEFHAQALIFGLIEGTLQQSSTESLRVGKSGWVQGTILSQGVVVIEGRVDGDIHASELVRVLPTGTVHGNIFSPRIEVQSGAEIEGNVLMKKLQPLLLKQAA